MAHAWTITQIQLVQIKARIPSRDQTGRGNVRAGAVPRNHDHNGAIRPPAMNATAATATSGLNRSASATLPSSRATAVRVAPHVGHGTPETSRKTHGRRKGTTPIHRGRSAIVDRIRPPHTNVSWRSARVSGRHVTGSPLGENAQNRGPDAGRNQNGNADAAQEHGQQYGKGRLALRTAMGLGQADDL